jgi:DNA-binding CsgD family transcriptional regulator
MNMILTRAPGVGAPVPLELDPLDLDPLALDPGDPDALDAMPIDVLIRAVIARASALTPDADPLLDVTVDGVRCALTPVHPSRADTLSPREREIARMVAQGYTNKMIASVLDISLWTVSTHLRRIFAKLGVSTRAAMVALVVERQP